MAEASLSSRNQIVVPREAREAIVVHAGDKLLMVVRGKTVVIPAQASLLDKSRARFSQGALSGRLFEKRTRQLGVTRLRAFLGRHPDASDRSGDGPAPECQ